jgi:hypothetical protein
MGYKLKTYQKAQRLPVNFPARKNAMKAAKDELLHNGCELLHGCGDGIAGWGNFWYTADHLRICDKPGINALDTVVRFLIRKNEGSL